MRFPDWQWKIPRFQSTFFIFRRTTGNMGDSDTDFTISNEIKSEIRGDWQVYVWNECSSTETLYKFRALWDQFVLISLTLEHWRLVLHHFFRHPKSLDLFSNHPQIKENDYTDGLFAFIKQSCPLFRRYAAAWPFHRGPSVIRHVSLVWRS